MLTCLALIALLAPDTDWAQWRGPNRDGLSPDTGLLKQWPAGGPALAWKATGLGESFSSVSIAGSRLFTLGDVGGSSSLIALNAADGKQLWTPKFGESGGKRNPGTRSTPSTDGTLVFAIGQGGELVCAEAETGKLRWQKSLEKDFGGQRPTWWWSESPLLDGDHVVCTPGGSKGTVLALKKTTGETVWQSAGLKDPAHYTSIVPVEIGAVRQYIVLTGASVSGIAAKDGRLLWRVARDGSRAVASAPLYKDGFVFVASGYGVGCNAYKVTGEGGTFNAAEAYSGKQLQNHHGGMILLGDHVYGLDDRSGMKCIELKTGKEVWSNPSVGKGSIAYADGHFVLRGEKEKQGEIALVEATPAGYKEKSRFSLPDPAGQPTWAHPVVFGGRLYLRNQGVLHCYDVKAK